MKKRLVLLIPVMIVSMLFCSKTKGDINIDASTLGGDKGIYQKALKVIKRQPERARLLFKELIQLFPNSIYAQKAKIGTADSYFSERSESSLIIAISEYEEFVNVYPNSPDAVYAKYQIGMCYFKRMRKPGRQQDNTKRAIEAFQSMVKRFPGTPEAEKAKAKIKEARLNLAEHYFRLSMTNYHINAFRGAINRFKQVLDDYPEFKKKDKLFFFTGKSYYFIGDLDTALSFFQRIINSYPKSKFLRKAKKYIKKVELAKKTVIKKIKPVKKTISEKKSSK
jgi:outer membrane protein assembly factor BamD